MSPVRSQPSTMVSDVATGFFQYPSITLPPLISISPFFRIEREFMLSSPILISMFGIVLPEEPSLCSCCVLAEIIGDASERP